MAMSVILVLVLLEKTTAVLSSPLKIHHPTCGDSPSSRASLLYEIKQARVKLAHLESNIQKSIQELNDKSLYIKECEKKIEQMMLDTRLLKNALASLEDDSSRANAKLSVLEGELKLLWFAARKNNFVMHTLEYRAQDSEKNLNVVKSQVEEMAEIVSEQWIQIQHLEQAAQMAQFRALKVKRCRAARCPFVKFVKDMLDGHIVMLNWLRDLYVYGWVSTLESCISEAPHYLKGTFSAAKNYHHQLQRYIKQSMLRNEITAVLAHEEVVFFVASLLITFPVLSIFMLFSSRFS